MKPKALEIADYEAAARILGCDTNIIRAFSEVESSGYGFWQFADDDWRPKILFEARWFHGLTAGKWDQSHPKISSESWNPALYAYGKKEYARLDEACSLDRAAGLQSASWGKFQIMGFNYRRVGYEKLQDFINAMYSSEADHLKAFCGFISSDAKLHGALAQHDFEVMALRYNGAGQVGIYASKLQQAYEVLRG